MALFDDSLIITDRIPEAKATKTPLASPENLLSRIQHQNPNLTESLVPEIQVSFFAKVLKALKEESFTDLLNDVTKFLLTDSAGGRVGNLAKLLLPDEQQLSKKLSELITDQLKEALLNNFEYQQEKESLIEETRNFNLHYNSPESEQAKEEDNPLLAGSFNRREPHREAELASLNQVLDQAEKIIISNVGGAHQSACQDILEAAKEQIAVGAYPLSNLSSGTIDEDKLTEIKDKLNRKFAEIIDSVTEVKPESEAETKIIQFNDIGELLRNDPKKAQEALLAQHPDREKLKVRQILKRNEKLVLAS